MLLIHCSHPENLWYLVKFKLGRLHYALWSNVEASPYLYWKGNSSKAPYMESLGQLSLCIPPASAARGLITSCKNSLANTRGSCSSRAPSHPPPLEGTQQGHLTPPFSERLPGWRRHRHFSALQVFNWWSTSKNQENSWSF